MSVYVLKFYFTYYDSELIDNILDNCVYNKYINLKSSI